MRAVLAIFALGAVLAPCLLGASGAASAQQTPAAPPAQSPPMQSPPAQPPPRQACRADFQKFCADVRPGSGRVAQCLLEHKDKLSSGCRDALEKVGAEQAGQSDSGKPK
jgi:hypothetical protein